MVWVYDLLALPFCRKMHSWFKKNAVYDLPILGLIKGREDHTFWGWMVRVYDLAGLFGFGLWKV